MGLKPEPVFDLLKGDRVGVKVPQFSFSRLDGADVTLGVEMASTGEVACFGENVHEAYLKSLISTGFQLPEKAVLLSIGSYKHKEELLPYVRILQNMNLKLYASTGTADFYSTKGISIEPVEWPYDNKGKNRDHLKNITDYLAEKEFDIVINLPMHLGGYARASHGYQTRRMAVNYAIPLITDVKCAKLLIESLHNIKNQPLMKPYIDCLTVSRMATLPGLIDVHVHLRDPGATHKEDFASGTAAALAGGVTLVCAMPNTHPPVIDKESFSLALQKAKVGARCDYALFAGATSNNAESLQNIHSLIVGIKMYLNPTFGPLQLHSLEDWKKCPPELPLCVHAEGTTAAQAILLSVFMNRAIHICHVSTKDEILLIKDAKEKGARVKPPLGTIEDQNALWENMGVIDCFATDHAPHTPLEKSKEDAPPGFPGLETMLPLLLTAVNEGRLTLEDIETKLYRNPRKIFNLPEQKDTYVEIDLDEEWVIPAETSFSKAHWTPFTGRKVKGLVRRVVLRGEVAFVDGQVLSEPGTGQNIINFRHEIDTKIRSPLHVRSISPALPLTSQLSPAGGRITPGLSDHHYLGMPIIATDDMVLATEEIHTQTMQDMIGEVSKQFVKDLDEPLIIPKHKTVDPHIDSKGPLIYTPGCSVFLEAPPRVHELQGKHVLKVDMFSRYQLHRLFEVAKNFKSLLKKENPLSVLKGKVLVNLFYEASTRTNVSFAVAMMKLGGTVVPVNESSSSVKKGESLEDTITVLSSYADVVRAAAASSKPILNGGDGTGEHPTQALLDVFTIREELGSVNRLTITFVGDLKHGRTVHSLARLLTNYDVRLRYVSPPQLKIPDTVKEFIQSKGIHQEEYSNLEDILPQTDVLYMTRIQKERFESEEKYEKVKGQYIITPVLMTNAKKRMIVMHPLPRVDEISPDFDSDPRAVYFRQALNGLYVRMALLASVVEH
ncbi:CAD protein [Caerostris extrusa]|uniref:aspartate carbamoyltransferase n=1 Tax=Caerostris extrusa TaxID=172846 RepID=A0AAV4TPC2_CAEEX|nr:CAD protein [Caerostris extrusa]